MIAIPRFALRASRRKNETEYAKKVSLTQYRTTYEKADVNNCAM